MRLSNYAFLLFLVFLIETPIYAQPNIQITYPKDGEPVFAADSTFIFGMVQPPESQFFINSQPVSLFPNGAFLVMIPLQPKSCTIRCQAVLGPDTTQQTITVRIPDYLVTSPEDTLLVDSTFIYPLYPMTLKAGDLIRVAVKGTPRCQASFQIGELFQPKPMIELAANQRYFWGQAAIGGPVPRKERGVSGVYTGIYRITENDRAHAAPIHLKLVHPEQDTLRGATYGTLTIDTTLTARLAQIPSVMPEAIVKYGIGSLYIFPPTARLGITGQYGPYYRIQLNESEHLWMKLDSLVWLPLSAELNNGVIYSARAQKTPLRTQVSVRLKERIPVHIEQKNEPASLAVTFYGVKSNSKYLYNLRQTPRIKSMSWFEQSPSVHTLFIELNQRQLWGYQPFFEKNQFILELRHPPEIAQEPLSALSDLVITLDPGHGPEQGAVGPTGLVESEANLQVCHRLKRHLEDKGALVVLTRDEEQGVALTTRPLLAAFVDSDVLISVHFNSLPDGVNPYRNRGTSTYYCQPMSYQLAQTIHESLLKHLALPDFGLYYRNFVLTRTTEMLSVLVEPAFIIHPEEEMLIRSTEFQEKIAVAITAALERFFESHRNKTE